MLKVSEGNINLQHPRFSQFVPIIDSRLFQQQLEGKADKGGVGFGDDK
jgi:hypothetical protein